MRKFYGREREMEQLREMQRQAYEDYSRFVVLTGRRRVGKTSLVYRLSMEEMCEVEGDTVRTIVKNDHIRSVIT